jgi:hypothetical protein
MGMALVVRCPDCRGASQIDPAARGLSVRCPRCEAVFVAVPEADMLTPARPKRNPTLPIPKRPEPEHEVEPYPAPEAPSPTSDAEHDPHSHSSGGLPTSVLLGLALLPFVIPVLWWIAPALFGQRPLLSLAVPLAIAISTSILSMAVIYTIDWSPSIRVKGVLMLLGLAYFSSFSLFFLKKDMVERIRTFFTKKWVLFQPPEPSPGYVALVPNKPTETNEQPVPAVQLKCYKVSHGDSPGSYVFVFGSSPSLKGGEHRDLGNDDWFDRTIKKIVAYSNGQLDPNVANDNTLKPQPAKQFGIQLPNGFIRIVQLYAIGDRVYYVSAEGEDLKEDDTVRKFFNSFKILGKQ